MTVSEAVVRLYSLKLCWLKSTCSLDTGNVVIPPKLLNGNVNNQSMSEIKYPVNLPFLSKFFTEDELMGLTGQSLLNYQLGIKLPTMKFFNSTFTKKLAVDQTIKYDLEKMAIAVKADQHIFSSLAEPVVTGDIFLPDSFFSSIPGIMLISTASFSFSLLIILSIVLYKRPNSIASVSYFKQ